MYREVVNALFGLLDQRVAINFPRQFFGAAPDFLERLIDRNRSNRDRAVPDDPLSRGVNVFPSR